MSLFCEPCGKSYKSFDSFAKHRNNTHTGNFSCLRCKAVYKKRATLELHLSKKHNMLATEYEESVGKVMASKDAKISKTPPVLPQRVEALSDSSAFEEPSSESESENLVKADDYQVPGGNSNVPPAWGQEVHTTPALFRADGATGSQAKSNDVLEDMPQANAEFWAWLYMAGEDKLRECLAATRDMALREAWARQQAEKQIDTYRSLLSDLGSTSKRLADQLDTFGELWQAEKKARMAAEARAEEWKKALKQGPKQPTSKPNIVTMAGAHTSATPIVTASSSLAATKTGPKVKHTTIRP